MAFGLAIFLVALGLFEGVLAVLGLGAPDLYEDPFVGFSPGRKLFGEKTSADGRRVYATHPGKLSFFDDQEFSVDKPADGFRIFALGGSTTAGRPYDWKVAFPHWMQLYLEAMDPSRTWEVVNAGAISYASYRIVLLMKELIDYAPDLFVIYTGHNEFLEERTYSDTIHQHQALRRTRVWLDRWRFYTLARQGWLGLRQPPPMPVTTLPGEVEAKLDGWTGLDLYHRDDGLRRAIVEHFEYNLRQMVAIARDRGAGIVFVKPVSNLKDFSPFKSEHAAGLSRRDAARFDALLAQGRELLDAGKAREALPALEEARALDPEYAEAHFRIGRALLALGEHAAAKAALVRARDLDVAPLRALTEIEELVAAVAAEHGLPLIDLPAILEADSRQRSGHDILGDEVLLDHVHPDFPTHSLIAERVIDVLVGEGVARRSRDWSEAKKQAVYDRLVGSIDRRYYAHRDHNLGKVLVWAGKLEEAEAPLRRAAEMLTDNPEVRLNLGILYEKTGRWEEAVRELRRAVALDPASAEAHFNLGTNLGYLGRPGEGVASLKEAVRLRQDYPLAFFNLGILYRQQGALQEADAAFARAAQLRPEAGEVPRNRGMVWQSQGRFEEASAAFRRALELDPGDVVARTQLGITYARLGLLEEAARELQQAVETDAGAGEAFYNLGVVYGQRGMPEEAAAAYERAVEVDPGAARALNNLGILDAGQGRFEEARRSLERAIGIDPAYAEAHFNLGIVHDGAGRPRQALAAILEALELEPENARMHFAAANLYQALGDAERSRFHFEKAQEAGFEAPPADP